ncbi:MAG: hypothetical protein AB7V62_10240 [Thermoleophilia bacterium]
MAVEVPPQVDRLLEAMDGAWSNGGAVCGWFRRDDFTGPRGDASGELEELCASGDILGLFAEHSQGMAVDDDWYHDGVFHFPPHGPLTGPQATAAARTFSEDLGGASLATGLAEMLWRPGAYTQFEGELEEAERIASGAADTLLGRAGPAVTVHFSREPWHPGLHGVAWDYTYVLLDAPRGAAVILAASDGD